MPVTQIPTAVLMQKPGTNGLPYAPVNKPMDLVRDPHLNEGGLLSIRLENGKEIKLPALPIQMDQHKFDLRYKPPKDSEDAQPLLLCRAFFAIRTESGQTKIQQGFSMLLDVKQELAYDYDDPLFFRFTSTARAIVAY